MRPHKPTTRSKSQGLARARLYFKDSLWWLRGFPLEQRTIGDEIPWVVVPELGTNRGIEQIALSREHLRKASFAIRKLTEQFPRALPQLVGNKKLWHAGVLQLLSKLKDNLHKDVPLPGADDLVKSESFTPTQRRRLKELAAEKPEWSHAIAWLHHRRPEDLAKTLRMSHRHADAIRNIGVNTDPDIALRTMLRLGDMAHADDLHRVAVLVETLGHPSLARVAMEPGQRIQAIHSELNQVDLQNPSQIDLAPGESEKTYPRALADWVDRIARCDARTRRQTMRLFELAGPLTFLPRWERWHRNVDQLCKELSQAQVSNSEVSSAAWRRKANKLEKSAPPAYPAPESYLPAIDTMAKNWSKQSQRRALAVLSSIPEQQEDLALRAEFVLHWHRIESFADAPKELDNALELIRLAISPSNQQALCLWLPLLRDRRVDWWMWQIVEGPAAPRREFAKALLAICKAPAEEVPGLLSSPSLVRVLVQVTGSGESAAKLLRALGRHDAIASVDDLPHSALHVAHLLAQDSVDRFAKLALAYCENDTESDSQDPVLGLVQIADSPTLLRDLILDGDQALVRKVAGHLALLRSLLSVNGDTPLDWTRITQPHQPKPRRKERQDWPSHYPDAIRPELRKLARVDPMAKRFASRLLRQNFPTPTQLEREIRTLREKIGVSDEARVKSLRIRLENLESRLIQPKSISADRLRRVTTQLRRRVRVAQLRAWDDSILRAIDEACLQLGLLPIRSWIDDPSIAKAMSGLDELDATPRGLLIRLLRTRQNSKPWDLRDDPKNSRFVRRMESQGLDMKPWIDGLAPRGVQSSEGQVLTLALEEDPLEVLLMGAHFGTCLSPRNFNYFSAVSNAVDINKRVLYARDVNGKVQCRCLLALTDDGRLLTFYPYSHDQSHDFSAHAVRFVRDLAKQLGTSCVSTGKVSPLVARDWYDDGPVDLTGQFDFLAAGSEFRKELPSVQPSEFKDRVQLALGSTEVDAQCLRMILALEEVQERPELVIPLLPSLRAAPGVEVTTQLAAIKLLILHGDENAARASCLELVKRVGPSYDYEAEELSGHLVSLGEPAAALRVLRKSRPRRVRRWEDESTTRLRIAGLAHSQLKRPRLALRLFRTIPPRVRDDIVKSSIDELEARLSANY